MTESKKPKPEHEHIWGQSFPLDRKSVRSQCVLPGCHEIKVTDVSKAP